MATKMSNFGGTIKATQIDDFDNSKIIPTYGVCDVWNISSERDSGTYVIIFSMVLNNKSNENVDVDIGLLNNGASSDKMTYVGKNVTVVPGRPVSLDYKVNLTSSNELYVAASQADAVDILISAVQLLM